MLRGLPASIIAHAAAISASYLTWPYWGGSSSAYITNIEAVDVNFAEIGEITDIAPLIAQEPEEEPAAPEEPEETVPEDPVEEDLPQAEDDVTNVDAAAAPEEDPADLLPDFDAEPQEEDPETEPEAEKPTPPPTPPRDPLADFLNQSETTFKSEIETKRNRPDPPPKAPTETPKTALKDAPQPPETRNRKGAGERNANIARIDAVLYSRIYPCWDGVSDLPFPERLNVRMKLELNQNGTIADLSLIEPTRRPVGSSPMGTAVDRALRAVRKCAPYNLPDDDYDIWREGTVNLGPAFTPTSQR